MAENTYFSELWAKYCLAQKLIDKLSVKACVDGDESAAETLRKLIDARESILSEAADAIVSE